ncbi:MAG: DUF2868 domain-containing protein [Desulfobulbus sp.]|jgi:hypothetical protein|uniref:DUF2868 domain-containing protein n=1 Tax=Desulfobulbus sp. TaxID=895 RepID=UPI0028486307|nr:DUF2868 domain-containing protein [Desulfobulbus sp.]MDR2548801.1 DUF2868 domain-containing protein [Desulfobulbus sp.]
MKISWTIADLIDFHYFSRMDEGLRHESGEAALAKRDRMIYLAKIEPQLGKADTAPPRTLVRKWLTVRRLQYRRQQGAEGAPLPGTVWQELSVLCQGLLFGLGLFAGLGGAGSLLLYAGTTPLNVSVYFGLFVLLQMAILILQGLVFGYRLLRRLPLETSVFYLFLGRMLLRGLDGIRRRLQPALTGRQRLDLAAIAGGVRQRKELAALLIWPAFALVQMGGIGFNLGVLGATLAKVSFADIAFAWQSSLQLSAELVAGLVRWIALPWSWWLPQAVPTLVQVQGSQMVLKEGIAHLETANLVAWWPFLCCAVVAYGLLPRCLLLMLALVRQRRALAQLHFATLDIRPLVQRMTAPRLDTNGLGDEVWADAARTPAPAAESRQTATGAPVPATAIRATEGDRWLLLIPDELDGEELRAALAGQLRPEFGAAFDYVRHGVPGLADAEILAPLALAATPPAGALVLHEAWQPPLKETETLVHGLRRLVGEQASITILLIGRPTAQAVLTPVDPEQLRVWSQKMRALGDPQLSVRPLVSP